MTPENMGTTMTTEETAEAAERAGPGAARPTRPTRPGLAAALWSVLRQPVPPDHRGYLTFGWLILLLFVFQVATGILLAFYYEPSAREASASVQLLMRDVGSGWLVRGLHSWSSAAIVVLAVLQLLRALVAGSYLRRPASWVLGLLLFGLILLQAFSGELLRWDDEAYWSAKRAADALAAVPLLGPTLLSLLQGGPEVSDHTLARAYAAHVLVVPWVGLVAVLLNLWLIARDWVSRREARP